MRLVYNHFLFFTLLAILAGAVLLWFGSPPPATPRKILLQEEPWELPKTAPQNGHKYGEAIIARNLWGVIVAGAKGPEWNVTGIIKTGKERYIMISFEGRPAEILKVGDRLPDGAQITRIEDTQFFILTEDKKKLAFGLYKYDKPK